MAQKPNSDQLTVWQVHRNSLLSAIWEIHELELAGQVAMVKDVIKSGQNPQDCLPEVWLGKDPHDSDRAIDFPLS